MKGSRGRGRGARGRQHLAGSSVPPGPNLAPGAGGAGVQQAPTRANYNCAAKSPGRRTKEPVMSARAPHTPPPGPGTPDTSPASGNAPAERPEEKQLLQNEAENRSPAGLFQITNFVKGVFLAIFLLCLLCLAVAFGYCLVRPTAPQESSEPCPDGWMYYEKFCYFYPENDIDWSSANSFCRERNAGLIVFKHRKEMYYIVERAGRHNHWIGLNKTAEGYTWVTGEPLDRSEFKIQGDGECGYIKSNNDRVVISLATCSLPMRFICKMEPYKVRTV